MPIRVQCGQCGSVMNIRDDYAGQQRRCPKCKASFLVPDPSASGKQQVVDAQPVAAGEEFDPAEFLSGDATPAVPASSKPAKPAKPPADDFDPLDVLNTEAPAKATSSTSRKSLKPSGKAKQPGSQRAGTESSRSNPAATSPAAGGRAGDDPAAEFDPLDVLGDGPPAAASPAVGGGASKPSTPASTAGAAPPQPVAESGADNFDPMAVLGDGPQSGATTPPAATPPAAANEAAGTGQQPQPKRPSWAKAPPPPEKNDWSEPAAAEAAPQAPQPKRPSWAKAPPPPEENDWSEPGGEAREAGAATPTKPRPSWAKPLPTEGGTASPPGSPAGLPPDASPAARAAAAAMAGPAGVSADNPALAAAKPKQPWINRAALVAALRRQFVVLRVAAPVALVLLGISWWIAGPSSFEWKPIGARGELTLVPVNGRVTHNNQGVAAARVVFLPHGQSFRSAEAVTDSDGRFELQFADGYAGTPPGKYRVQIQKMAENGRDMIPSAYGGSTRQTYEVMPGGSTIDVDIKTAEPK